MSDQAFARGREASGSFDHRGGAAPRTIAAADAAACRAVIRRHSKSFHLSSLLLPSAVRPSVWAVYAFCRLADDCVDGDNPGDGRVPEDAPSGQPLLLARVRELRRRLERAYGGDLPAGDQAVDRAFSAVAQRCGLPKAVPGRLLDGMEQDARGQRYGTYDQLLGYCFNVAGTVGLMMTYVLGHRMPAERSVEVALRAIDLGVAMQLSNIARDVGEDARRGRVYLPDDFLSAFGLTFEEVLATGRGGAPAPPALSRAVRELLLQARVHYRAASAGIAMLPPTVRLAIRSAQLVYSGIDARLEDQDYDPFRGRVYVPLSGKLARVALALTGLPLHRHPPDRPTTGPEDALWLRQLEEMGLAGAPIAPPLI